MISPGFYPLVLGLATTSALLAYFDFLKGGDIPLWAFVPGTVTTFGFIATSTGFTGFVFGGIIALLSIPATWFVLTYVKRKKQDATKIGTGDYLTIALFSFWSAMMVYVIIYSLTAGVIGKQTHLWDRGARTIPLAGLMGVFCLAYIAWSAVW